MKHRIFLTLLLVVSATMLLFFNSDLAFPDGSYDDAKLDIEDAAKEQLRLQTLYAT